MRNTFEIEIENWKTLLKRNVVIFTVQQPGRLRYDVISQYSLWKKQCEVFC